MKLSCLRNDTIFQIVIIGGFIAVWLISDVYWAVYLLAATISASYLVFAYGHLWSIVKQLNLHLLQEVVGVICLLLIGSNLLGKNEWASRTLFTLPEGESLLGLFIIGLYERSPGHAVMFYVLMLVLFPLFAYMEEELFRGSAFSRIILKRESGDGWLPMRVAHVEEGFWSKLRTGQIGNAILIGWISQGLIVRNLWFGIIHLLNGVPIGTVIMQVVVGFWLCYQYTQGGVLRSAAYHTYVNYLLFAWYIVAGIIIS